MDFADMSQTAESLHRQAAIAGARPGREDKQLVDAGLIVCRDCGEPIASARLAILPTACRCVPCQEEAEASC
uniref:DnaK suppressor protein n=1 Tax=Desulfovibrio sp. U5L TaxID=596152 RepID=I2Q2N7_9BACT